MTSSTLWIGPIRFSHHVQGISLEEHKAVDVLQTTRTSKNLVADSGSSVQKATIRLLITGLNEINSELRELIILFRSCPIISVDNELINSAWGIVPAEIDPTYLTSKGTASVNRLSVPVALESLSLTTVPDVPYSMYVSLQLSRIDVTPVFADGRLLYIQEDGAPTEHVTEAFYLRKWLSMATKGDIVPVLSASDFSSVNISWYGEFADGNPIEPPTRDIKNLVIGPNPHTKVYSESCSIRNLFAYNKFIGKGIAFPQMMGSTARFYSMDVVFTAQDSDYDFQKFVLFKESSDYIARAKDREARIAGWIVKSPVAKLLRESQSDLGLSMKNPGDGAYVPTYVSIENGEEPFTKIVKVDMAETGTDFFRSSNAMLLRGGTDYDGLKRYFDTVSEEEQKFRTSLKTNRAAVAKALSAGSSTEIDSFSVFWPLIEGSLSFSQNETFGILNRDSIRAAMLDSKFDKSDRLQLAVLATTLVAGKQVVGNKLPDFFTRFNVNTAILQQAVLGPDELGTEGAAAFAVVNDYVTKRMFVNSTDPQLVTLIAKKLFLSFFGNYSSFSDSTNESGEVVALIAASDLKFSTDFLNSLFTVVIERRSARKGLERMYAVDSLHASFLKLLLAYNKNYSALGDEDSNTSSVASSAIEEYFSRSVYEDLELPRYKELFGDKWQQFAPRYSDLGIVNAYFEEKISIGADASLDLAVTENDVVPPFIFFFHKKYNSDLKSKVTEASSLVSTLGHKLQVSVPFNSSDIAAIEVAFSEDDRTRNKSLPDVINTALRNARTNDEVAFDASMRQLTLAYADKASNHFFNNDSANLSLYLHNNNGRVYQKHITTPGLAGMLYKVAKDYKYLRTTDTLPQADVDQEHRANGSEYSFIRGLDENTKSIIKSDLDQNPDIHECASKMFPAIKVYLLEKRGSDLFGDDSFFSVNPIVSVDITLDKDDADLAVITIADPLYILQNSKFPSSNIARVSSPDGSGSYVSKKQVLASLRGNDTGGYLKRNKIIEGRPVQIRLGYDSMPKNLKTVFTGRIVEIQPGDMLTIVCQGWKAELINNQVAFSNDNVKNWGARDLAIMTMQHANPEGFGDIYPQRSSDYLLKNLQGTDINEMLATVLQNQEGVETVNGSRSFLGNVGNSLVELAGLSSIAKDNKGLDTRLKNIWWADIPTPNNFAHWRYWTTIMPSQMNDSWIIPLQPAWEALKESSRHAWNSIVQVVPFDGEATVFFGHPDQPYYFTKGGSRSKRSWEKYNNKKSEGLKKSKNLIDGFLKSNEYDFKLPEETVSAIKKYTESIVVMNKDGNDTFEKLSAGDVLESLDNLLDRGLVNDFGTPFNTLRTSYKLLEKVIVSGKGGDGTIDFSRDEDGTIDFFSILGFFEGHGTLLAPVSSGLRKILNASNRFEVSFGSLREKLGHRAVPIILRLFLGIPESQIATQWPEAYSNMPTMMSPEGEKVAELMLGRVQAVTDNIQGLREQLKKGLLDSFDIYLGKPVVEFNAARVSLAKNPINGILVRQFEAKYSALSFAIGDPDGQLKKGVLKELKGFEDKVEEIRLLAATRHSTYNKKKYNARENFYLFVTEAEILLTIIETVDRIIMETPITTGDPIALSGLSTSKSLLSLKLFVYFFDKYLSTEDGRRLGDEVASHTGGILPPNMKVFRQHHYIDADHDIIRNEIVASTRDMWNTAIIEHPAHAEATSVISSEEDLFRGGDFFSGIKWVYWPKNEISGVTGLQFHPGLTLANKKVRIFTELNCQSNELAAKLACTHLAEGIKRMYRGTLLVNGRVMKPYDRIILHDDYTKMTGPLEVESVIHHWSIETGWVTNIAPQAVCDANPGAAILHTAALEDMFVAAFAITDYAIDAITLALAISTLGGATSLAPGAFSIKQGLAGVMKSLLGSNKNKFLLGRVTAPFTQAKALKTIIGNGGLNLRQIVGGLAAKYGGLGRAALAAWTGAGAATQALHTAFRLSVTSAYIADAQKVEQLPIILTPLLFEGMPFLAGMDTDDPVWAVAANDVFWNLREINQGMESFIEQIFGESTVSILESTTK